jgi:ABC-type enterochelin transport system permease subunit
VESIFTSPHQQLTQHHQLLTPQMRHNKHLTPKHLTTHTILAAAVAALVAALPLVMLLARLPLVKALALAALLAMLGAVQAALAAMVALAAVLVLEPGEARSMAMERVLAMPKEALLNLCQ